MSITKFVDFDIKCDHCTDAPTETTSAENLKDGEGHKKSVVEVIQQVRTMGWKVRHMKGGGIRVKCPTCAEKKPEAGDDDNTHDPGAQPAAEGEAAA